MDPNTSLSKGCFAFVPKSSTNKTKKQNKVKDEFDEFNNIPQVKVYSSIMKNIEKQIKEINTSAADEVLQELVKFIFECSKFEFAIPTAVLLTGINLPDHRVLFQGLSDKIHNEVTPHVSVLLSSDCTNIKNTIEHLTSQFLKQTRCSMDSEMEIDESDSEDEEDFMDEVKRSQCTMPNLLKWYEALKENTNPENPNNSPEKLVIIIPDFEGFTTKVLQDLILILSGYIERLPLVLVVGVATSVKALQSALPHGVTSRMAVRMFQSKPSVHFLNNTVNEIFLTWKHSRTRPFFLGPKIFKLLIDVFIFYDFSVHGFIQGVKYCLMEHFYSNPLSKLCCPVDQLQEVVENLTEDDEKCIWDSKTFRDHLENLPAKKSAKILQNNKKFKKEVLSLLNELHTHKENLLVAVWMLHTLVYELPNAPLGKQVREVFVEVMSSPLADNPNYSRCFELLNLMSKQELLEKINKIDTILKDSECLEVVKIEMLELKKNLENAGQNVNNPAESPTKKRMMEPCKDRSQFRQNLMAKAAPIQNEFEKARSSLLNYLKDVFLKYLVSPSSLPLHEVMVVDDISAKRHIIGAHRAAIHIGLNNPHHYLKCDCCKLSRSDEILPTMPDLCIAYKLHLESQALINMYDWLQSFATIISPGHAEKDERKVDPAIQARFTRAVAELQFLGFIKGSKKKTDHVARLTWGSTS